MPQALGDKHATIVDEALRSPHLQHEESQAVHRCRHSLASAWLPGKRSAGYELPLRRGWCVADHVHILFDMGKMCSPKEFVERLKRESSKFVKTLGRKYANFYWQRGCGMFSVSPTLLPDAEAYVRKQEEHHRTKTFQDELREFLNRYGIDFDERYVWD